MFSKLFNSPCSHGQHSKEETLNKLLPALDSHFSFVAQFHHIQNRTSKIKVESQTSFSPPNSPPLKKFKKKLK
jgi:hypothetical protein